MNNSTGPVAVVLAFVLACVGLFVVQSSMAKQVPETPAVDPTVLSAVSDPETGEQVSQYLAQEAAQEQERLEYSQPDFGEVDPDTAYWLDRYDGMARELSDNTVEVAEAGFAHMTAQAAFHNLGLMAIAIIIGVAVFVALILWLFKGGRGGA
jgi:uncharacterized membrane protein (UPF0182 family)